MPLHSNKKSMRRDMRNKPRCVLCLHVVGEHEQGYLVQWRASRFTRKKFKFNAINSCSKLSSSSKENYGYGGGYILSSISLFFFVFCSSSSSSSSFSSTSSFAYLFVSLSPLPLTPSLHQLFKPCQMLYQIRCLAWNGMKSCHNSYH